MSRALLLCCALLVLVAGFGGTNRAAVPSTDGVTVEVTRVVTYPASDPTPPLTDVYSLTCSPTPAGTLPFAERICRDIREHPQAMLAPRALLGATTCHIPAFPDRAIVTFAVVVIASSGARTELREIPHCKDPGRVARNIFAAATYGDEGIVALLERALPCAEDPVASAFAKLTDTNRRACMFGSWNEANRTMIRIAASAPAIAALDPAKLFMPDPGAQTCRIPVGGAVKAPPVRAQCGVYITGAIVSFVEEWSGKELIWSNASNGAFKLRPGSAAARHVWDVLVMNGRVKSVTERGAVPPQQRR